MGKEVIEHCILSEKENVVLFRQPKIESIVFLGDGGCN